jgi:hypothetical protein
MLLLAGMVASACGGGDGDAPSAVTPQQVVSQLVQQGYLKASNTNANDLFGANVAISGDTLAVGAYQEDSNATGVNGNQADNSASNSGAVYIFTRSAGVWSQQAYLKASNTGAGDNFGWSVAIEGDTLAVGAPFERSNATGVNGNQQDNSMPGAGAVYVFTRSGGTWSQQAYLKASNTDAQDNFGISVALAGDTLAVGGYTEDSNATGVDGNQADNSSSNSGAVYVFTRTGGIWAQEAYVKASNTGGLFGYGVALQGDTLTVGAPWERSNATGVNGNQANTSAVEAGAVYVFTRTAGVWTQEAYLKASNTNAGDRFGLGIGLDGDTLIVGARLEAGGGNGINEDEADNSAPNAGAAYVFTRAGGTWSQQAYLKPSNGGPGLNFGGTVAIVGDIIAVGARLEDSNATGINGNQGNNTAPDSGAVYLFKRTGGVWAQQAYVKASNSNSGDQFGVHVAVSGNTLIVGAYQEASNATGVDGDQDNNSAANSGAAYVFELGS